MEPRDQFIVLPTYTFTFYRAERFVRCMGPLQRKAVYDTQYNRPQPQWPFLCEQARNADMIEALFWRMLDHLQTQFPGFGSSSRFKGRPPRFKKSVYSIDSSSIALLAN